MAVDPSLPCARSVVMIYAMPAKTRVAYAYQDMADMSQHAPTSGASSQTLDIVMGYQQTAEFLNISERTLERYVREGLIPYVRLPQRGAWSGIRFLRSDLLKWLQTQTVKPRRERLSRRTT
jgi:excisionase family DNA binding protein